jgi:hypothetical protein
VRDEGVVDHVNAHGVTVSVALLGWSAGQPSGSPLRTVP